MNQNKKELPIATEQQLIDAGRVPVSERDQILNEQRANAAAPNAQEGDGTPDLGINPEIYAALGFEPKAKEDTQEPGSRAEERIKDLAADRDRWQGIAENFINKLGELPQSGQAPAAATANFDVNAIQKPEGVSDDDWADEMRVLGPIIKQAVGSTEAKLQKEYEAKLTSVNERVNAIVGIVGKDRMKDLLGDEYTRPEVQSDMDKIYESLGRPESLNNEKGAAILFAAAQHLSGRAAKGGAKNAEQHAINMARARTEATPSGGGAPPNAGKQGFLDMSSEDFEKIADRVLGRG